MGRLLMGGAYHARRIAELEILLAAALAFVPPRNDLHARITKVLKEGK